MADKLVFDQIAHPRLEHAYQYRDSLIVLQGTVDSNHFDREPTIHITMGDGRYLVLPFETDPLPIEDALLHAAERIDVLLEAEPTNTFRRDLLELQHNYLHGDLSLVD